MRNGDGQTLAYHTRVFDGANKRWRIEADSSNAEFITEPFDERREMGKIAETVDAIETFVDNMIVTDSESPEPPTMDMFKGGKAVSIGKKYLFVGDIYATAGTNDQRVSQMGVITSAPQATGGITLDRIPDLVDAMHQPDSLNHLTPPPKDGERSEIEPGMGRSLAGDSFMLTEGKNRSIKEQVLKFIKDMGPEPTDPEELAGYRKRMEKAQLVLKTINEELEVDEVRRENALALAQARKAAESYVEALLKQIQSEEKQPPKHGFKNLKGLLVLVMSYLISGNTQPVPWSYSKIIAPLMARTDFHQLYRLLEKDERPWFDPASILRFAGVNDGPVYRIGFYKTRNQEGEVTALDRGPKRSDWLKSIRTGGIDLMSEGSGTTVATSGTGAVGTATSMGAQHDPDVVDGVPLAVLELRRLPKNQKYTEWKDTALLIAKLFASLRQ